MNGPWTTARWTQRFGDHGRPLVIAHRGASALAPENTAESFAAAVAVGADAIETDVRMTADGVPVCVHDADLRRLCGADDRVDALPVAALCRLLPKVLTLADALRHSAGAGLLLDVKLADAGAVLSLLKPIREAGAADRVLLGLRHLALAEAVAAAGSDRPAVLAFASDPDSAADWRTRGAAWFRLWQADLDARRAAAVRDLGMGLAVMTGDPGPGRRPVGSLAPAEIPALLAHRPDAVLLDDPRLLA